MSNITLGIDDVQVIDSLYPRLRPIEMKIQEYQDNVEAAPRITVARGCVLVDGYHRWQAHKRNGATTVEAIDLGDMTDEQILVESVRLNSRHGSQLAPEEKRALACELSHERYGLTQEQVARTLAVSVRQLRRWLDADQAERRRAAAEQAKAERERNIAEAERLRAEGKTQRAIGEQLGVEHRTIGRWLGHGGQMSGAPQDGYDKPDDKPDDKAEVADPEPQPEPLDDETRQYLEQWSEDGDDLVAEVESGRMTVADATKHANTIRRLYEHSDKHSPFKAHGEANQSLKAACDLISNFLSVSPVALDADDPQLWRRLRTLAPQAIERLSEWKEATDARMD